MREFFISKQLVQLQAVLSTAGQMLTVHMNPDPHSFLFRHTHRNMHSC